MTAALVEIDERRLLRRLDELAQRGVVPGGGITRVAYTPAWVAATELVSAWMRDASFLVRRDAVGNVWGRVEGSRGGRAIVTGSHIDTVRSGGALDGALGIVAGIEALASLVARYGRPKRIVECVAIAEHEGTRFGTAGYAARAVADRLETDEALHAHDADGTTLADALRAVSLEPANAASAVRRDIDAFVELHVEQGPVLDDANERLAVVTAIGGNTQLEVVVTGEPGDAASTTMERRRDALVGAAEMIAAIAGAARDAGAPGVATVGEVAIEPAQPNVVPALVRFTVDARHADDARRAGLVTEIEKRCKAIGHAGELTVAVRRVRERNTLSLNARIAEVLRRASRASGVEPRDVVSVAGHDAQLLAPVAQTGMLFLPSIGGRSHRPDEATAAEDVVLGTRVLATALHELAFA